MKIDLEQILLDKAVLSGKPFKATLELSPICNFDCEMCYIRHSRAEVDAKGGLLSLTFWGDLIDQLKSMGVLVVCLIGGEPFLYPGIERIYQKLVNQGFLVNITTNASLLANGVPNWLRNSPPRYVTVSLYGADDDTYKNVTGNANGFSMAMKGIENLLNAGIAVKLNFLATPGNKHDLEKIFEMKNKYGLPLLATSYSHAVNRKEDKYSQNRLTALECAEYDMKAHYLSEPDKYLEYCRTIAEYKDYNNPVLHDHHISCYAGKGTMWVNWQGELLPCSMLSHVAYSLKKMKLEEAWTLLRNHVSHIETCAACAQCACREICRVCAGSMHIEGGSTKKCPEYLCAVTHEMIRLAEEFLDTEENRFEGDII